MPTLQPSPTIENQSWGEVKVTGYQTFRDVKLFPGGARDWNWQETGTRHSPGVQPADVDELLQNGAAVVILSTGVLGRLRIQAQTLKMLKEAQVTVHVKRTREAVRLYNEMCEHSAVGALIHSTC